MVEELRLILSRITRFDMKRILSRWGRIPANEINYKVTKYQIVQQILEIAERLDLKQENAYHLDLLYLMDQPFKKLWSAYHLIKPTGLSLDEATLQPLNFERCLLQKLFVTHACNVQVQKHKYALWGRVGRSGSAHGLYFIYFPRSSYFLMGKSAGIGSLTEIVTRVLKQLLGYERCEKMELESNYPDSLAQILLHSSNSESVYTYDEGYYKPLGRCDSEKPRSFCDERVRILHMDQLKKDKDIVDVQYGKTLQPKLQSLTVSTSTYFRGRSHIPKIPPSTIINCRTKIVGDNVLEGLRKAALHGYCHTPLPTFLTDVARTGNQCIRVTDHREPSGTGSESD